MNQTFVLSGFDQEEGPYVSGKKFEEGNHGHRMKVKGGYFPVAPLDSGGDLRAEMLIHARGEMGVVKWKSTTTKWRRASMSWA